MKGCPNNNLAPSKNKSKKNLRSIPSIPTCSRIPSTLIAICQLPNSYDILQHPASTKIVNSSIWQMVTKWRCIRLSSLSTRPATTLHPTYGQMRRLSASPSTSSNIATILATPPRNGGHAITVEGSIRTIRNQKQRSFVELGDGSTAYSVQAVLDPQLAEGHVQ